MRREQEGGCSLLTFGHRDREPRIIPTKILRARAEDVTDLAHAELGAGLGRDGEYDEDEERAGREQRPEERRHRKWEDSHCLH